MKTNLLRGFNFSQNRNIKLFLLANFLFQFGLGIFMVMNNIYIRELGFPKEFNGSVVAMGALASAIILIPAGLISDRVGRKRVIIFGIFFGSLTFFLRALVEDYYALLATAFLSGLFLAFIQVSAMPFLAENTKNEERVNLFSLNAALVMLASMLGNIFGGLLSDLLQVVFSFSEVFSLKITLFIGASFQFLAVLPVLLIDVKDRNRQKGKFKFNLSKNKKQFKLLFHFSFAALLIGLGSGLVIPYLNLYFYDRFAASKSTIGIIVSLGQLATAIAMILGPWLVKRIGDIKAVVLLQLLSIPFLLLTGYTNYLGLAVIGFLFRQALMNAGNPIQQSFIMSNIDDNMKGLANSLSAMVFNLGWAIMGPVSTTIVARNGSYKGYAIVFTITAVLYTISSIYFYLAFGRKKFTADKGINTVNV